MVPEVMAGAQDHPAAITTGFKLILEKQSMFVVLLLRAIEMAMNGLQFLSCPFLLMVIPGKLTEINKTSKWYDIFCTVLHITKRYPFFSQTFVRATF